MPDHAIVSIAYQFHRMGKLLSSYRVEYMEDLTFPVDLTLIIHKGTFGHHWTWMDGNLKDDGAGACLEDVDPTTEEAQKVLRWDRPLNRGGTALVLANDEDDEQPEGEAVYRVTHDLFEIVSHSILGNSNDLGCSCGLEWEADAVGFEEILVDCNYPNTYHTSSLAEIIQVASERVARAREVYNSLRDPCQDFKDEGQLLLLYSWDGSLDSYAGEFDSWWEYIGPITDSDLSLLARLIAKVEEKTAQAAQAAQASQIDKEDNKS